LNDGKTSHKLHWLQGKALSLLNNENCGNVRDACRANYQYAEMRRITKPAILKMLRIMIEEDGDD
jgi:hypothetical protein